MRTLRNAVQSGNVHHAYLFVGSRGTGKTSMAKMLAACLNCVNGPTTDPCGQCESCVAIANATSLDVIEMDAASNNSVDDIRELRDAVQFAPVSGRYKVYILDEAHMLSTAAWNAFLKTLEEPPPQTIFVLATTEAHKVMDTVVDRCHRFDFRRPTAEQLATVVRRVADKEGIGITPEAVALVARHASGSYRDALGTLEQLVTYAGKEISTDDVLAVLGVADDELLFGAIEAIIARDAASAWRIAARIAESGRDAGRFLSDLEAHARDVLVVQTLGEVPPQLSLTAERDARLLDQARRAGGADVVRLLDLLAAGMRLAKDGADAQTQLEIALVKSAQPEIDASTRALLARLERVERALAGGAAPAPAPQSQAQPQAAPRPAAPQPPASAQASAPQQQPGGAQPTPPPSPGQSQPSPGGAPAPSASAPPASAAPAAAGGPAAPAVAVAADPSESEPAPAPESFGSLELDQVVDLWQAVIDTVGERNQLIATCLADGRPVAASGRNLAIAFPPDRAFQKRKVEGTQARELIAEAVRALTGVVPVLDFETREREELGETEQPEILDEEDFVERLRAEFDAVDHEEDQDVEQPPSTQDQEGPA